MTERVCAKCCKEMKPEKNGVWVFLYSTFGLYQIWSADLWKCPCCGVEIISGFGKGCKSNVDKGFAEFEKGLREDPQASIYEVDKDKVETYKKTHEKKEILVNALARMLKEHLGVKSVMIDGISVADAQHQSDPTPLEVGVGGVLNLYLTIEK